MSNFSHIDKGCGRTLGHGESCCEGHLCDSCASATRIIEKFTALAATITSQSLTRDIEEILEEEFGK